MIGYVTLGTDDLERARTYFDALFGTIAAKRLMQFADEDGGFTMWGTSMGRPAVVITRPYDKQAAHHGNGNMVALVMDIDRQGRHVSRQGDRARRNRRRRARLPRRSQVRLLFRLFSRSRRA